MKDKAIQSESSEEIETLMTEQEQTDETITESTETAEQPKQPQPKPDDDPEREKLNRQSEVDRVRNETRVQTIIEVVRKNPWTEKPIENAQDVEEYLLMQKIDSDGKDPIEDYPEYVKKQRSEKEEAFRQTESNRETARKQIEDFKREFPDVNLQELAKDTDFDDFAKGAVGNEPLTSIYKRYANFCARISDNVEKKAKSRAVSEKAKANASVGSLSTEDGGQANEFYTLEQMQIMSQKEIHDNWDKVQKSMKRLNK